MGNWRKKLTILFIGLLLGQFAGVQVALADPPPQPTYSGEPADIPSNFDINPLIYSGSPAGDPFGEGKFRTACDPSHLNYDDMILYPGMVGASHLHQYAGNTGANANSTYESLRTTGESTCGAGKINRSAYWIPALMVPNQECDSGNPGLEAWCVQLPNHFVIYYNVETPEKDHKVRIPRGLRYVFGFEIANPTAYQTRAVPPGYISRGDGWGGWSCTNGSSGGISLADYGGVATMNCPAGEEMVMSVVAPGCWNGVDYTTENGRDHVVPRISLIGSGVYECPATHPYEIAEFQIKTFYTSHGNTVNATKRFSCDNMPGHPQFRNGECGHSDWFGAWDYGIMKRWMRECNGTSIPGDPPGTSRSCVFTQFGDGTAGDQSTFVDLGMLTGGAEFVAVPPDPSEEVDPVVGYKTGTRIRRRPGVRP